MFEPRFIERFRQLSYSGQVVVQPGEWVQAGQTVARIDYLPGALRRVELAHQLNVSGSHLRECMLLHEGDPVQASEALAISSCFGERKAAVSPHSGFVGLVSRTLGYVYVRQPVPVGLNQPVALTAAEELGVNLLQFRDCLRVHTGAMVVPGQVLAVKKNGIRQQFVQSPIYGKVTDISKGVMTLEPLHVSTELTAYLTGRVTRVLPGQGAYIRALAHVLEGRYGVGGETGGELLLAASCDRALQPGDVDIDWKDKIVVSGGSASLAAIEQAASVGVRALVLAYLPLHILLRYAKGTKAVGLTGDEDIPMPIILLAGFLETSAPEEVWASLTQLQGRYASVNGTTHIRAGVIRPEIVVCEPEWPAGSPETPKVDLDPQLRIGGSVRILRGKLAGQSGHVLDLPKERQRLTTGSVVRVVQVSVGGRTVQLPVANLELLPSRGVDLDD